MSTCEYRNWGRFTDALGAAMDAARKEKMVHFGTPRYFRESILAVHRAFQKFCREQDLDPAKTRLAVADFFRRGNPSRSRTSFDYLLSQLPNEFNVRGVWTPEP